jgi:hypothetical protein
LTIACLVNVGIAFSPPPLTHLLGQPRRCGAGRQWLGSLSRT